MTLNDKLQNNLSKLIIHGIAEHAYSDTKLKVASALKVNKFCSNRSKAYQASPR